jgi:Flp pilus assembly secretin CpaC
MSAKWVGIFAMLSFLIIVSTSYADSDVNATSLQMTTDQTKIIHLQRDAANVIVNNPDHASVALESPRLLLITPHQPGTTSMIVLDGAGKTIMQRDVIVTNVRQKYVRIRRICSGSDSSCAATSYTYCPDGCYDVTVVPASAAGEGVGGSLPPSTPPGTIGGEPAETLIGPADDCPEGYNKIFVPGITSGDQHYTCTKR